MIRKFYIKEDFRMEILRKKHCHKMTVSYTNMRRAILKLPVESGENYFCLKNVEFLTRRSSFLPRKRHQQSFRLTLGPANCKQNCIVALFKERSWPIQAFKCKLDRKWKELSGGPYYLKLSYKRPYCLFSRFKITLNFELKTVRHKQLKKVRLLRI